MTVERPRNDGPFHVGDRYEVVPDGPSEHISGVIVGVRATGLKHVEVKVELSDARSSRTPPAVRPSRMTSRT